MTLWIAAALFSVTLWITAALFAAVIIARIVRDAMRPEDPSNPYDI